jgi:hypothetical protein
LVASVLVDSATIATTNPKNTNAPTWLSKGDTLSADTSKEC